MTPSSPYLVYEAWPADTVAQALQEFNDIMHDGAGIDELAAGLHGLDFLTRKSELSDTLAARLSGSITEANMRIALMAEQEAAERTRAETFEKAYQTVRLLARYVAAFQANFIDRRMGGGPDDYPEVQAYVRRRVDARMAAA